MKRIGLWLLALGLTACGTSSPGPAFIPEGSWGSATVGMTVTGSGAAIGFCCASGAIPPPLVVDSEGGFRFQGTYTGTSRKTVSATYSGVLDGTSMNLTVVATPDVSETSSLTYGRQPDIVCPCPFIPASR